MRFSEQWLREWIDFPGDIHALAQRLTLAGLETEMPVSLSGHFSQVVVGRVVEVTPHPDASRLRVCQIDLGTGRPLSIVCGASNVRADLRVAVACVGAVLPRGVEIKAQAIRGVPSQGMLCSSSELGLSDESQGILELPVDAPIGQDLQSYLQLQDYCLEVHVTPNRGDCLSVRGVARELAALAERNVTGPIISGIAPQISEQRSVAIESLEDCPYYVGRVILGINSQAKTPLWMLERLRRSGVRAIHPVVDVANYVMLELGQPLHAFDLARLDSELVVRRAREGERCDLLEGKEVFLDPHTLVIADKVQVHAIAGVMGGTDSAISMETRDVFLEGACFNPAVVAGRARHYGLTSEAAHRFERGVDPYLVPLAMERATQLLMEIVGGKSGPLSVQGNPLRKRLVPIELRNAQIGRILGVSLAANEVKSILQRLGMSISQRTENAWQVMPPTWRFDLVQEIDLIEEVARVHGYDQLPQAFPKSGIHFLPCSEYSLPLSRLRHFLVDRDYQEAITYSFISPQYQQQFADGAVPLSLSNPISSELSVMRTSLWPGLLGAVAYNQKRQQPRVRLFETGLCFRQNKDRLLQEPYLAAVATGDCVPEQWGAPKKALDFFSVKSDLEALLRCLGSSFQVRFVACKHPVLHPGQASEIIHSDHGDQVIGSFGALHPRLLASLDLLGPVYLFEISLSILNNGQLPYFRSFSKFPAVRRDISFWIDKRFPAQLILEQSRADAGAWLVNAYFFDVYSAQCTEQEKNYSLALALIWQHPSRTLIDTEVDDLLQRVVAGLEQRFAACLKA